MFDPAFPTIMKRGILRGLLTLLRSGGLKIALGVLLCVYTVFQAELLLLFAVEGASNVLASETDTEMNVFPGASDTDVQNLYGSLHELPYVRNATYVTKEQRYEESRETNPELVDFLDQYGLDNPFSDTIRVSLASLQDSGRFSTFIREERWKSVVDPVSLATLTSRGQDTFALLDALEAGRFLIALLLCLTIAALTLIVTVIVSHRATAEGDEVLVERLAGAAPSAILLPFIAEAALLLLLAAAGSGIIVFILTLLLPLALPSLESRDLLITLSAETGRLLSTFFPLIVLLEILAAPVIASIAAWIGIWPSLRTSEISLTS